ncbi:MAG: PaREP1 family protein [Thermoproteota archaeon]
MITVTTLLPEKVLEALREKAESEGKNVEEFISEAVLKQLNVFDPDTKTELHLKLCEKYLKETDDFLAKKDYVQASEKAWGAAAQVVKAVAAKRGLEIKSHKELHAFVAKLKEESGDSEIRSFWQSAGMLHQNFYENWLPPEMVEENINDIKKLVEKLRKLLK